MNVQPVNMSVLKSVVFEMVVVLLATACAEPSEKDIWLFGGGQLFRTLLDAGLVDTVEVAVMPVLLGEGIPVLPGPGERAKLRLTKSQVLEKTGTVTLQYDVEK